MYHQVTQTRDDGHQLPVLFGLSAAARADSQTLSKMSKNSTTVSDVLVDLEKAGSKDVEEEVDFQKANLIKHLSVRFLIFHFFCLPRFIEFLIISLN
jgi:hypothetical protein